MVRRSGGTPMLMAGYHVPGATHPDLPAVVLLSRVLGQMPSGRLAKELVDTKRAAKSECMVAQQREPGYLLCLAELRQSDSPAQVREPLLAAIEQLAKKPVTKEEVERAKAETLKMFEMLLNSPDRVGIFLSEYAALGDWRLFFVLRDRLKAVTVDDVNRVAQKYLVASNRTFGEYVPTENPVRAEIPPTPEVGPLVDNYKGSEAVAQGEVFDASPKNIDARIKYATLPNGAKLVLLPKKTRGGTVHLALRLRYGTEQTLRGQDLAVDLAGRMLMRGTKTKTREQITDALDKLAAQVMMMPDDQQLTVMIEVRRPQLAATLAILADVLKNPAFDAKEFELLRREVVTELEQQKQEPMALGMMETQRMLSPWEKGHPRYVPSIDEALAELNAAKVEAARDFHQRFYGAQNLIVSAVGDFDEAELQKELGTMFGAWSSKEPYVRIPEKFTDKGKGERTVATPDKPMAFLGLGERIQIKDTDPDYPALVMANYLLGGGFLNGRVPKRLREKEGLSYGAGTMLRGYEVTDNALFFGYAIYNPANLEKVQKGFFEEIEKAVAGGFTEEELKLGKQGLSQQRKELRSRDEMLAMVLAGYQETGRRFTFDQSTDEKLEGLTLPALNAAIKKYLDPKRLATLKVGDFKKK